MGVIGGSYVLLILFQYWPFCVTLPIIGKSLGEMVVYQVPAVIFAGGTRNKTEVLSTTVFLELSIGDLEAAVAVSLLMVLAAVTVLIVTRIWGGKDVMV